MRGRGGFTLMEVLMALSILTAGAAVMVAPLYRYAQRSGGISVAQVRNGIVAQQVGRLTALPFDSLASRAGCTTITRPPLPHIRCITLTTVSTRQIHVSILITPTSIMVRPGSASFDRTRVSSNNPFST